MNSLSTPASAAEGLEDLDMILQAHGVTNVDGFRVFERRLSAVQLCQVRGSLEQMRADLGWRSESFDLLLGGRRFLQFTWRG
jgi:hypothetical protein